MIFNLANPLMPARNCLYQLEIQIILFDGGNFEDGSSVDDMTSISL